MRVPDGWRLVPVEPTWEMHEAGSDHGGFNGEWQIDSTLDIYKAMLAASPVPPQADDVARAQALEEAVKALTSPWPEIDRLIQTATIHLDADESSRLSHSNGLELLAALRSAFNAHVAAIRALQGQQGGAE